MNRPNAAPLAVWGLAAGFSIGCGAPPVDSGATSARESLQPFQLLIDWQVEPTYLGIYLALERGHFERLGLDVEIVQRTQASVCQKMGGLGRTRPTVAPRRSRRRVVPEPPANARQARRRVPRADRVGPLGARRW